MSTGMESIERAAAQLMEQRPQLSKAQAVAAVLEKNPSLYAAYLAANPAQTMGR